jgi:hypothetical protein
LGCMAGVQTIRAKNASPGESVCPINRLAMIWADKSS